MVTFYLKIKQNYYDVCSYVCMFVRKFFICFFDHHTNCSCFTFRIFFCCCKNSMPPIRISWRSILERKQIATNNKIKEPSTTLAVLSRFVLLCVFCKAALECHNWTGQREKKMGQTHFDTTEQIHSKNSKVWKENKQTDWNEWKWNGYCISVWVNSF